MQVGEVQVREMQVGGEEVGGGGCIYGEPREHIEPSSNHPTKLFSEPFSKPFS